MERDLLHRKNIFGQYKRSGHLKHGASPLTGGAGIKIFARDGISPKTIFLVRNLLIRISKIIFPQALHRAQTYFN